MSNAQALWQQLQQQGLVVGDMPAASEKHTPWYVRVMLGVAGWIGALFLLGFVGVGFEAIIKSAEASIIVGLIICAAAYILFRWQGDSDFGAQFGLAVSMAGQGLFMFGLFDGFHSDTAVVGITIFIFQALLAIFIPNSIHRTLTSWSAMLALTYALMRLDIYGFASGVVALGFTIIWSHETLWAMSDTLWRPIGYGLALALLQIETLNFFGFEIWSMWSTGEPGWLVRYAPMIANVMVTVTFLWVVKRLLDRDAIALDSDVGMIAFNTALLLGVLSLFAHGLTTALLILLLGFAIGNRLLMGLGLLALFGFMSHYYYQLQHTLLFKSMVLIISGSVLLAVRFALHKYFPFTEKENDHA